MSQRPLARLARDIADLEVRQLEGRVSAVGGLLIEAAGPAEALKLGARARIDSQPPIGAEIVGFRDGRALLLPFDAIGALRPGARVQLDGTSPMARPCGAWLGRVINAFGEPLDGKGPLPQGARPRLINAGPPPAHQRARVGARLDTGVKAIDTFTQICRGQRMGVFAGSGVGKSVLMSMLARGADAQVIVIGLIGERGREVKEFIEDTLGEEGLARAVIVVATSDEPAARRRLAAQYAACVAEYFRDEGDDVLLMLDSVTRFAIAQREIGLAAGEPPTTKGYTPSVFAELPRLLERAGPGIEKHGAKTGSITGVFTVLVDGDDHNEPIADAVRSILDGHIVMSRRIAERGRYPSIDVLKSISRLMPMCGTAEENAILTRTRALLSAYADMEELIRIGAYKAGADSEIDNAIRLRPGLESFLSQDRGQRFSADQSFAQLEAVLES